MSGSHDRPVRPVRPVRPTWRDSDRFMPRTFVRPVLRFMQVEASSGLVLLVAAVVAVLWANSPWRGGYEALWDTRLSVALGDLVELDELTLRTWVNDAAMALFFLLAGLEIKRQLILGELRTLRAAALPALAALGGMVVPALLYTAINAGHPGAPGWGIPVATDIAFAVGIVALAGPRIPLGARIFILTLAVVDDIGGIVVIAVFYADDVSPRWLLVAVATVAITVACRRAEVRSLAPYLACGAVCWLALHEAGVEAAIVGVVFGLLTPVRPYYPQRSFAPTARHLVDRIERTFDDDHLEDEDAERNEIALEDLARFARETSSPLERIEARLTLWVSLFVVPLFALANAGVRIDTASLDGRVVAGVVVGLVAGKAIGVFTFSLAAVRLGVGELPAGTGWRHIAGLAVTAGIGFTVALYVAGLSFDDGGSGGSLTSSAKVGVLAASTVAGTAGFLLLRTTKEKRQTGTTVATPSENSGETPAAYVQGCVSKTTATR